MTIICVYLLISLLEKKQKKKKQIRNSKTKLEFHEMVISGRLEIIFKNEASQLLGIKL